MGELFERGIKQDNGIGTALDVQRDEARDPEEIEPESAAVLAKKWPKCFLHRSTSGPRRYRTRH